VDKGRVLNANFGFWFRKCTRVRDQSPAWPAGKGASTDLNQNHLPVPQAHSARLHPAARAHTSPAPHNMASTRDAQPTVKSVLLAQVRVQTRDLLAKLAAAPQVEEGAWTAKDAVEMVRYAVPCWLEHPHLAVPEEFVLDWLRVACQLLGVLQHALDAHPELDVFFRDPAKREHAEFSAAVAALVRHTRNVRSLADSPAMSSALWMDDEECRQFWAASFGCNVYVCDWAAFAAKLAERYASVRRDAAVLLEHLALTMDPASSGVVTCRAVAELVERFGPGLEEAVLRNHRDAWSKAWFAGHMTREEAECLLVSGKQGDFCVRFSVSRPCGFAVAVRGNARAKVAVEHMLVLARAGSLCFAGGASAWQRTLQDCVSSQYPVLLRASPRVLSLTRAPYFWGVLAKEDQARVLHDQPSGAFLVRFSTTDTGDVVIAYKAGGADTPNSRSQIKFGCKDDKFLVMDCLYSDIAAIVRTSPDKLQYGVDRRLHARARSPARIDVRGNYGAIAAWERRYDVMPL
jgi:hypothetical protein